MLKVIPFLIASLVLIVLMMLFLDLIWSVHAWLGCLAKIQFMPALKVDVVVGLIL